MTRLKDIPEFAEHLNVSPWTVRSLIRQGKLHVVRIGRRVLLEESELERIIREGRKDSNGEVKNDN